MQMTRQALFACAIIPALCPVARAQEPSPAGTAGKPPLAAKIEAVWPTVLTRSAPSGSSAQLPPEWSAQDIEDGRARCAAILKGLDLVAVPAEPIHEVRAGKACGTPAPMQLVSIGSSPKITFSPPATLTCDMIAALYTWLQRDVQPLARKHLGTPVAGVKTMSSFSCRNAYSRPKARLSEHGRVNAIDIGGFATARGETRIVADWGPNAREIATKAAAARAEAIKRKAEAVAVARNAKPQDGPRLARSGTSKSYQAGTAVTLGLPSITLVGVRPSGDPGDLSTALGWAPPSRLGGPKEVDVAAPALAGNAAFLHAIHKAACAIFSTVLGPEANKAHKDHFHLDLAKRRSPDICE